MPAKVAETYIGVAVPHMVARKDPTNCQETGSQLKALVERGSKGAFVPWTIPAGSLKVGTLDNLVGLSDEMGKYDASLRNCAVQIQKIYLDYGGKAETLTIGQKTPAQYLGMFKWNPKWNTSNAMKKIIIDMTTESRTNLNNLMKIKAACVECTRKLAILSKQTEGNLTVRDFEHKLRKDEVFMTDVFKTIYVVVPKGRADRFMSEYSTIHKTKEGGRLIAAIEEDKKLQEELAAAIAEEKEDPTAPESAAEARAKIKNKDTTRLDLARALKSVTDQCAPVIPQSALEIDSDNEFKMFRVIVVRKCAEAVQLLYKEQRFTVRELTADWDKPKESDAQKEKEKVEKELKKHKKRLIAVCKAFFSGAFDAWCHLKAIRLFVEAVLRYGLPVAYTFSLIEVKKGQTKIIHDRLTQKFQNLSNAAMQSDGKKKNKKKEVDYTGLSDNYRPYVFTEFLLP